MQGGDSFERADRETWDTAVLSDGATEYRLLPVTLEMLYQHLCTGMPPVKEKLWKTDGSATWDHGLFGSNARVASVREWCPTTHTDGGRHASTTVHTVWFDRTCGQEGYRK